QESCGPLFPSPEGKALGAAGGDERESPMAVAGQKDPARQTCSRSPSLFSPLTERDKTLAPQPLSRVSREDGTRFDRTVTTGPTLLIPFTCCLHQHGRSKWLGKNHSPFSCPITPISVISPTP